MNKEETILWDKIRRFQLDDPEVEFTFTERLARENSWSMSYAVRAVLEYKKFIFLVCIAKHPLTPSDQVDQVWHLHLIYTESYWSDFCTKTLGRKIHHGPTKGGKEEKEKYNDWYEETRKLYLEIFEVDPPSDIWPSGEIRFGELNFIRVNLHRYWVIPKFFKQWKY